MIVIEKETIEIVLLCNMLKLNIIFTIVLLIINFKRKAMKLKLLQTNDAKTNQQV